MNRLFLPVLVCILVTLGACAGTEHATESALSSDEAPTPAPAASPSDDTHLPLDPNVRIDTLDNGVVYYIRANDEPKNRAELRLALDAGSVLEDDDQQGLAHFVEHMLFNGTRRFQEQDLIDFLERTGMRFGPDINAYTSFDETVYMLEIPTDSAAIVERAFDVLEDWAGYATLSDDEIDKERGVVVEEWRSGRGAGGRISDQILPVLLAGSHYKDRLPIGDTTTLRHADYETLRRFYRDWYRPDLMAVVAVGDFEVDRMEALIREHFATLPSPGQPRPRPTFDVPGHEETLYKVATDPEYPITQVQVNFKQETRPFRTIDDYRDRIAGSMFNSMLNKRFAEISRRGDAAFLGAGVSRGGFVRPSTFYSIGARVHDDSILVGLEAVLTEAARVRLHGFTETELARQKQETLRAYERAYNERENTNSAAYAGEYVNHFLEDEPAPGIAYEYALIQQLLPEITVEEVNRRVAELLAERNRVVLVTMPEKESLTPPTEAELAAVLDGMQHQSFAPYVDDVTDAPLIAVVPDPAAVTAEREITELGITEITLENGIRVVMKPTDFKDDEVRFTAFSPGGHSLVPDAEFLDASLASALMARSGVGAFDRTALQKKLSGKVVSVSPYIGELEEGLRGSASPEDLETLFQLIHLYVTAPRADTSALVAFQNQQRAFLANRSATPGSALQDTLITALYGNHPRYQIPTVEQIDHIDLQRAYSVYRDRFADMDDFTFIFVGNFEIDALKELARTYLGTLPATPREETWRDVSPDLPTDVVAKTVKKGQEPQSQVVLIFHGPFVYDREHRHRLRSLEGVLDIKLREELREERAGIYSAAVQSSASSIPDSTYQFTIFFGCDPERAEELIEAVFAEIEEVKGDEVLDDYVAKVQEQQRRQRETSLEQNGFWVGTLDFYYSHPNEDLLDVLRYDELIDSLTGDDIRQAARRYFDADRYVKVVLYPEHFGEE
ncbi:MAG: M16 family metallopeptidase [Rhodothermales bacterium]